MHRTIVLLALIGFAPALAAQPADCTSSPPPTENMPLSLQLNGLPGVPKSLNGEVYADVPVPPPGGTTCGAAARDLPKDILRGPPGDLLRGHGPRDILGGQVRPRVEVLTPDADSEP